MPTISSELKCPHCGAKVGQRWKTCWLCGLELPAAHAEAGGENGSSSPEGPGGVGATIARAAGVVLAGLLVLIFIGLLANGEYGGAIALTLLLLPAGIATLVKSLRKQAEGGEVSLLDQLGTFFLSLAVTIGAIVALGVAAFVALFIACLSMMSGSGNMFR